MGDLPGRLVDTLRGLDRPVCAYVYDLSVLRQRAAALAAALPPGARLLYAVKANGHPDVVRTMASTVDGLEVASGGELRLAVEAGARLVAFSGPAKTDAELAAAVAAGCIVHVESRHELDRLAALVDPDRPPLDAGDQLSGTSGRPVGHLDQVRVAVRVNRAAPVPAGTHQMTATPTPFGVDEATLPGLLTAAADRPGVDLVGFHLHAVSNSLDAAAHAAYVRDAVDWSVRTAAAHRIRLSYVNAGGGLGVDYTGGTEFDLDALRAGLRPGHPALVLEPGRYLAADAGWYAAEVVDLKRTHGRWFAVLRGGTHHFRLPAAWGYSHPWQVLPVDGWPHRYPRPQLRDAAVDLVGELCTPRDVLARDRYVRRLRVGDIAVLPRAGAYGWEISHREFLRHAYPQIVVI